MNIGWALMTLRPNFNYLDVILLLLSGHLEVHSEIQPAHGFCVHGFNQLQTKTITGKIVPASVHVQTFFSCHY
jgi:hypothetical protein